MKAGFRELIALVKPENRVVVGPANPAAVGALDPGTLALLFNCETKMLLVPGDLDATEARAAGKPSDDDFGAWFLAIDHGISSYLAADYKTTEDHSARMADFSRRQQS